jgi:hypothetical protein
MPTVTATKSHNANTLQTALVVGVKDYTKRSIVNGIPVEVSGWIFSSGDDLTVTFESYVNASEVQAIVDAHSA